MSVLTFLAFVCGVGALSSAGALLALAQSKKDVALGILIAVIAIGTLTMANIAYRAEMETKVCHEMGGKMAYDRCWLNTETNDNVNTMQRRINNV